MRPGAFTLLEVLIVVAILSLLVAVLLPSLSRAQSQTRRVVCASNLTQLHKAWVMYLDAAKGSFQGGVNMQFNYGGVQGKGSAAFGAHPKKPVSKSLNKYLGAGLPPVLRQGGDVFRCPCDTGVKAMPRSVFEFCGTSYAANPLVVGRALRPPAGSVCLEEWTAIVGDSSALPPKPGLLTDLKDDNIAEPSRLVLMGDATWLYHWEEGLPMSFHFGIRPRASTIWPSGTATWGFVLIRKGIHVDGFYAVTPTPVVRDLMLTCQQEIACP